MNQAFRRKKSRSRSPKRIKNLTKPSVLTRTPSPEVEKELPDFEPSGILAQYSTNQI